MPLSTSRDEQPSLNLTPMIDIVFLLIIFFMVGTRFTELTEAEKNIPLEVPVVSRAGALTDAPRKRVINVYENGSITLDSKAVTLTNLTAELMEAREEFKRTGVIVRGDAQGDFQYVAEVFAACRDAGISDLGISVRPMKR
jgi:biopolymer transport protein ExbD